LIFGKKGKKIMNKKEWEDAIEKAVQDGEFAFWAEIVKH
jgi:hypothetical protein